MRKKKVLKLVIFLIIVILVIVGVFFVLNAIKNKRIKTITEQVNSYIKTIEKNATSDEENIINKNIGKEVELDEEEIKFISGSTDKPVSAIYNLSEDKMVSKACFVVSYNKAYYRADYKNKEVSISKTKNDCNDVNLEIRNTVKNPGTEIYFNPETGKRCNEKDYDNNLVASKTGNLSGCMKWYTLIDEKGNDSIELLLDHNTTALVAWSESGSNKNGPSTNRVLKYLKKDTDGWAGVKERNDKYEVNGSYTVDYTGYRARLITAEEVAKISGNTSFDITSTKDRFYFGTNTSDDYSKREDYKWLFPTMGGCFALCDNPDSETYNENEGVARSIIFGYWTASSLAGSSDKAWLVYNKGELYSSHVKNDARYGVRPVIKVKKSKVY